MSKRSIKTFYGHTLYPELTLAHVLERQSTIPSIATQLALKIYYSVVYLLYWLDTKHCRSGDECNEHRVYRSPSLYYTRKDRHVVWIRRVPLEAVKGWNLGLTNRSLNQNPHTRGGHNTWMADNGFLSGHTTWFRINPALRELKVVFN
jgi:hypothetical protein